MSRTLQEFLDGFNYSPYMLDEVAQISREVSDCDKLKNAAIAYINAIEAFENVLAEIGYEFG